MITYILVFLDEFLMKFTFKVDGIGLGSINQGLGQQCAYIFKPFKRGRTFHFFGEGLLSIQVSIVKAITFLNQSVAKPEK